MLTDHRGIPLKSQFANDSETMIEVLGPVDDLGRAMFRAYWITDQPWVPGGVRAQVFNTNVDAWIKKHEDRGETVRRIGEGAK